MNKKISNVDALSALFDRLITERIKHYFFVKEGNAIAVAHQNDIIMELKIRIANTFQECLAEHNYEVMSERRTFTLNDVIGTVDTLTLSDILVGENDRKALEGLNTKNSDMMSSGITGFRTANENRSKSKNLLDSWFQKIFKAK